MGEKALKLIGTVIGLALIPLIIGWGINRQKKNAEMHPWSGSFYNVTYSKANQLTDSQKNKFKTLEACKIWVQDKATWYDLKEEEWTYNCGKNCKYVDQVISGGKRIQTLECEETSE